MSEEQQQELGKTLWAIADSLRGSMNADDFRDYMLSFLFLRYLSGNYESPKQLTTLRSCQLCHATP
jgi:type I restriction enzyme M protein